MTAQALLGTGEGRIIITACREDQKSWIGKGAPLTYFAQALGDGLRGRGPRNNGGFISAYGLYEHVYTTVKEVAWDDKRQTQEPELTVIKGVGPYAVALYRGASSLGEFDAEERVPTEGAVNEVKPEKAARVFSQHVIQSGGVNFGQNNKIDIQGDVVAGDQVAGDKIDARGAQGFINRPTGPVTQHFGTQITNYYQTASEVPESAMATWSAGARTLYGLLRDRWFDTNDLEDLTFQLNLDWDNLRGDTKMAKARALVAACESLGLTENLRRLMRLARPNLKDQLA